MAFITAVVRLHKESANTWIHSKTISSTLFYKQLLSYWSWNKWERQQRCWRAKVLWFLPSLHNILHSRVLQPRHRPRAHCHWEPMWRSSVAGRWPPAAPNQPQLSGQLSCVQFLQRNLSPTSNHEQLWLSPTPLLSDFWWQALSHEGPAWPHISPWCPRASSWPGVPQHPHLPGSTRGHGSRLLHCRQGLFLRHLWAHLLAGRTHPCSQLCSWCLAEERSEALVQPYSSFWKRWQLQCMLLLVKAIPSAALSALPDSTEQCPPTEAPLPRPAVPTLLPQQKLLELSMLPHPEVGGFTWLQGHLAVEDHDVSWGHAISQEIADHVQAQTQAPGYSHITNNSGSRSLWFLCI